LHKDRYDLQVSCAGDSALQAYLAGIDCALRFDASGIAELTDAVAEDEEFALAHAMLGRQLQIHGFDDEVKPCLDRAIAYKPGATRREQSAIDVIVASASFDPQTLDMARSHVDSYARDVAVLSQLLGPFGLLAFSGQRDWQTQNMELLKATQAAYPADDWWHMATRSFMAADIGEIRQAREDGERAWTLCKSGNCAHALAHVHFEAGALDEGIAFITDWKAVYGAESDMRHHLMWHLALLGQEGGAGADALMEMYESELDPGISDPMPLTTFSDNASTLWRCKLSGMDVPANLGHDLLHYADRHYPTIGFAFVDIHRVMSTALLNDREQQQSFENELARLSEQDGTEQHRCMLQFAKGFNAFADSDYVAAVTLLEPVLPESVLLGGSTPQRRIVEETYREAQKRVRLL